MLLKRTLLLLACFILAKCADKNSFPSGTWIDLSYDLSNETLYWPTSEPFKLDTVAAGITPEGFYYSAYNFCAAEHGGTHIDAPVHFAEGTNSVDKIPLQQLIAPVVKIDVSDNVNDADYQITIKDLTDWESENGKIPDGCIVLLQTGYGKYWPDALKYLGTAKRGTEGVAELHFPGLDPEAAAWLVKNRKIKAIGIDTASIDYGQSQTFNSHVTLMKNNIPALENVANLDKVPVTGSQIIALPIKIKGGSGGPVRIVVFIPDGQAAQ
jgi:kynurenine formamidase